jgi:phosphoribosylamine--glycine ligase
VLELLLAAARGDLSSVSIDVDDGAAVTVVIAAGDYPAGTDVGTPIGGIDAAEATGALVFHAGTARSGDRILTNGGRILNVTGLGPNVAAARDRAYEACDLITFPDMRYRRDIAAVAHV